MVIARVQKLLGWDWQVLVRHVKEPNRAADYLVAVGHSLNLGVCFYLTPFSCLGDTLQDDLAEAAMCQIIV